MIFHFIFHFFDLGAETTARAREFWMCWASVYIVTGHPLPLLSTQLLECVEILKLSADSFETRFQL